MNVLIVDDDTDLRHLLGGLLVCSGYQVQMADCAAAGLASLVAGGVDLVITDWMLGDSTGGAMLEQAHVAGVLAGVGVIIFSSSSCACRPASLPDALVVTKSSSPRVLLESVAGFLPTALPLRRAITR